jgi:radical SAM protein with 4Fe4S-binding SPASM domain
LYTHSPQYIQLYPTLKCNLSCPFCFNREIPSVKDISIDNFQKVISVMSDIGVKEIDMLGGEPTLHPEFKQIIDFIYSSTLKTTISSNGHNINLLREISRRYNGNCINVGVSINSDSISGELHEYIITHKPLLKSVCSKKQLIPEIAKGYLGMSGIEYYLIFMDPLYKDDLKNSLPFYEFFQIIHTLKELYENVDGVFCSGFIPDRENYPVLEHVRCPAGTTKLAVMPDGYVYPCYLFFRNREFRLGNILVDDFYRIWKNPILDFFRRFEKNSCINTGCELFSLCHGGCPAVSFLISGDINAPDPRCVYRSSCHSSLSRIFLNPTLPSIPSHQGRGAKGRSHLRTNAEVRYVCPVKGGENKR